MYHVECIDIKKDDAEFEYAEFSCLATNNMYNVTNYYIRNLMTGLKKSEKERTENEQNIIKSIQESIPTINKKLEEKYNLKISNIRSNKKLSEKEKAEKIKKVKHSVFEMPTKEKWFAGYNLLDAVFKFTGNTDYHSHHSHLIQNAITSCVSAWKSFFEQPDDKKNIPGYKKSGGKTTAIFSNIACKIKHGQLQFPYVVIPNQKKKKRIVLNIIKLPHALN